MDEELKKLIGFTLNLLVIKQSIGNCHEIRIHPVLDIEHERSESILFAISCQL